MSAPTPRLGRVSGRAGLFILVSLGVFALAILQAGVVEPLFSRTATLRILLPEAGLAGLERGADVQLFGAPIGEVTEVVIRPDEPFYAETQIEAEMQPFIRRDSRVVLRRQFGIAGNAFLDISRGRGEELDWDFAVLEAETERAPTEGVGELIEEARERILPLIDEATRAIVAAGDLLVSLQEPESDLQQMLARANAVTASMQAGEGTVGRLLTDDSLLRRLETTVTLLNTQIEALAPVLAQADTFTADAAQLTGNLAAGTTELPALVGSLQRSIAAAEPLLVELAEATPAFAETARGAGQAAAELPQVLRRTSQTLAQLEELLDALRRSWLIGGGGQPGDAGPTPLDVRP
jgi:phospholipid/cholesterol/gamma-HCH transport system substrate-binding protein